MTSEEIDKACNSFLQSGLSAEDFFNEYITEQNLNYSFEDSKLLLLLFYSLRNVDEAVLEIINKDYCSETEL